MTYFCPMNNEFIPYEEALELKELGFDERCFSFYDSEGELYESEGYYIQGHNVLGEEVIAPTPRQAFKWFREKYSLFTTINVDKTMEPKFCYSIDELQMFDFFGEWKNIVFNSDLYYTYEEAELDCLKKLIEIAKNK